MNKGIQEIQKNMQTTFEGYVNGQKFTNRDAMNQFIGQCISEGKPITSISYSSTTSYNGQPAGAPICGCNKGRAAIERAQQETSWITHINAVNSKVPQPYDSVIGYIVPFIHEDIKVENAQLIIDDFKARLNERMQFLEAYIFGNIRTKKYDVSQVCQWLESLSNSLLHKMDWSNQRVQLIEKFLNEMPTNDFITNHVDMEYLKCFHAIYSEAAGFCSALIDICSEFQKQVQCGCGK